MEINSARVAIFDGRKGDGRRDAWIRELIDAIRRSCSGNDGLSLAVLFTSRGNDDFGVATESRVSATRR